MNSSQAIQQHIHNLPQGEVFSAATLAGLGSPDMVRKTLSLMAKAGEIMRVGRGLYTRPKTSKHVGTVSPTPEQIVNFIASETSVTIATHGAEITRKLGLSTQMQMQPVYYTTGNSRNIQCGKIVIKLKHIAPRKIFSPNTVEGDVISALWYIGKENLNNKIIAQLQRTLTSSDFEKVLNACSHMPMWMAKVFYQYLKTKK